MWTGYEGLEPSTAVGCDYQWRPAPPAKQPGTVVHDVQFTGIQTLVVRIQITALSRNEVMAIQNNTRATM